MSNANGPLRVGIGGPVGSGKTALMDALCKRLAPGYDIAAITNDIYTKEDAEFLTRAGSLPPERIMGIETGGCPHTAIREDASINLAGIAADMTVAATLQAFAANLISAAVRLVPLGQSAGLSVLAALEAAVTEVAVATAGATLDDLGGVCFRSDLAALCHETQYTRLFRS